MEGSVYLDVPAALLRDQPQSAPPLPVEKAGLAANEFRVTDVPNGQTLPLTVNNHSVLVYNVNGEFYATDEACTHAQGPLSAGLLDGKIITCLLHGSCFDVTNGAVVCAPATKPLQTYPVTVVNGIGSVEIA